MPTVRDLYRRMSTDALTELRAAFVLDLANGADQTFCRGRIALIDEELQRREPLAPAAPERDAV